MLNQDEDFFWTLAENLMRLHAGEANRKLLSETHEQLGMAMRIVEAMLPDEHEEKDGALEYCTIERAKIDFAYKQLFGSEGN